MLRSIFQELKVVDRIGVGTSPLSTFSHIPKDRRPTTSLVVANSSPPQILFHINENVDDEELFSDLCPGKKNHFGNIAKDMKKWTSTWVL